MKSVPLILALFIVLFIGCAPPIAPGSQDNIQHLVNDYYVIRTSAHYVQITPMGYTGGTPIIPTKVIKLNVWGDYIIAYRQGLKPRSPDNPKDTYEVPNPDEFDYWILDTKEPRVFESLNEDEFTFIKDSLSIPDTLQLVPTWKFK